MGEGHTPLVRSARSERLYFKLESLNPSGSYKDRFIAAEIACLRGRGARACVATSSGNTGSSLAAYCARYDVRCAIVVNQDAPAGKLAQMRAHGAAVIRVAGFAADARVTARVFALLQCLSAERNVPLVVSAFRYCPLGMAGVESIAAEIAAECGDAGHVFVPVGGGGLYAAVVQGFQKLGERLPRVHAVQPAGCSTVVSAFERGDGRIVPVESSTRISGLSVPNDIDASLALKRLGECGAFGLSVQDEAVFAAQRLLLETEGIYAEPAGAAAFAGWRTAVERGIVGPADTSVCLVTGHGFKDPASLEAVAARREPQVVAPDVLAEALSDMVAC
jgi:threonine synthase